MLNYFQKILKYACPIFLISVLYVAITGIMAPWTVAEKVLGPRWEREYVLIGTSYEFRSSENDSFERRTHTYVGLPSSPRPLQTLRVIQENGAVRIEEEPYGLLSLLLLYAGLAFGTWWFWIGSRRQRSSGDKK